MTGGTALFGRGGGGGGGGGAHSNKKEEQDGTRKFQGSNPLGGLEPKTSSESPAIGLAPSEFLSSHPLSMEFNCTKKASSISCSQLGDPKRTHLRFLCLFGFREKLRLAAGSLLASCETTSLFTPLHGSETKEPTQFAGLRLKEPPVSLL